MCNPLTLIAGGLQAVGSLAAGRRSAKAARFQAEIARRNAEIAQAQGAQREATLRSQVSDVLAQQTAGFAARGIDPGSVSPLAFQARTAGQGEVDARLIRADTLTQVASAYGDAAAASQKAADARFAGLYGAGAALVTTAADLWPGVQSAWRKRTAPTPAATWPGSLNWPGAGG